VPYLSQYVSSGNRFGKVKITGKTSLFERERHNSAKILNLLAWARY